ncbi:hypothetical protein CBR_g58811 [Chara braunii]|uniref:Uncharacterized protein n=1 Tax=Chara braunii TaxID=69332 RepID=A0A388K8E7_CHABU|nr:hypothetical protein CBR_g58811 [Chara braunii]|eukprot:GBG66320.1 hypothetical protein CBR_g58811 [Chara braunii]
MDAIEAKSSARATRAKNLRHKGHGKGGRGHNQGGGDHNKVGGRFLEDSSPFASEAQRREREPLAGKTFYDGSTRANVAKTSVAKHGLTEGRGGGGGGGGGGSVEPVIDDRYSRDSDAVWRAGGTAVGRTASSGSRIGLNIWQSDDDGNLAKASRTKEGKAEEEGDNWHCRRDDDILYDADERLSSKEAAEVGGTAALLAGAEQGGQAFIAVPVSSQGEDYAALLEHQFGDFSFTATARLKSSWRFSCRWEDGDPNDPLCRDMFLPYQEEGSSKAAEASQREPKEDLLSVDVDDLADALATMPWSFCLSVEDEILPQEMRRGRPAEPSSSLEASSPRRSDSIEHTERAKEADMTTMSGRDEGSARKKFDALSAEGVEGTGWMPKNPLHAVEHVTAIAMTADSRKKVEMASSSGEGRTMLTNHSDLMWTSTSVERHTAASPIPGASDDEGLVKTPGKSDEQWREQKALSYNTPAAAGPQGGLWRNRHQERGRPTSLQEEESKAAAAATTATRVSPPDDGSVFSPSSADLGKGVRPVPRTNKGNHPDFKKAPSKERDMWGKDEEGDLWRGEVLSGDSKLVASNNQRVTSTSQVTGNYSGTKASAEGQKQHGDAIFRNRIGTESRITSSRSTVDVGGSPGCLRPEDELDDLLDVLDGTSVSGLRLLRREIPATATQSDPSAVAGAVRLPGRPRVMGPLSGPRQEPSWSGGANATRQSGGFPKPGAMVNKKYDEVGQIGTSGQRETTTQVRPPLPTGWPQNQRPNQQQQADGLGFMTSLPNTLAAPQKRMTVKDSPLGVSTGVNEGPRGKMKANLRPIPQMNIPATAPAPAPAPAAPAAAAASAIDDDEFDAWFDSIR